jgi:chromosome segregation ATPase
MMNEEDRRMSLFNRYATLGDEASAMRKKREALQEDIESIKEKEMALLHEDNRLRRAAQNAQQSMKSFHDKIRDLEPEYQQVKDAVYQATAARDAARRRRNNLQNDIAQERLCFLESSVEFRASCKRLRASTFACGLEQAAIQAYMETNGVDTSFYDELDGVLKIDHDDLEDDPATWNIDCHDQDMTKQLETYLEKKELHDTASSKVCQAEIDKQTIWKQLNSRQAQEDNLQGQAERIAQDNADLEHQIQELMRMTAESEQKKAALLRRSKYDELCSVGSS